ncbi:MAG: hypothetical protein JO048_08980, partial [Methylobacteriaceae bacterium]|nr:hypothetical protein [Methylobacteriaceae bacterium]
MRKAPTALDDRAAAALFATLEDEPGPVLVAVSGGPDSTALLHLLAAWARAAPDRPALAVATVDHGLRPRSRAEAEAVAAAVARLDLPHCVLAWAPPGRRVSQQVARTARYALLLDHAREIGASALATA